MTFTDHIIAARHKDKNCFYDGKSAFHTEIGEAFSYPSKAAAEAALKKLKFPAGWIATVVSFDIDALAKKYSRKPREREIIKNYRERQTKGTRRNPVNQPLEQARRLSKEFHGTPSKSLRAVDIPAFKGPALTVGEVHGIIYQTKDGRRHKEPPFLHEFKSGARPTLLSSHDGRQIHLTGGAYRFTERGIVDKSRRRRGVNRHAQSPRRRRKPAP